MLCEQNPDQLRQTVMFLVGINCGLRVGDKYHNLPQDSFNKVLNSLFSGMTKVLDAWYMHRGQSH